MFENKSYDEALKNSYFAAWAKKGKVLSDFHAITHPSQPNYFCQIAGDFFDWKSDNPKNITASTVVDLLEQKGMTWKSYQEKWPSACFTGNSGTYVRKHNPFISFENIYSNPKRCANIVDATKLDADLQSGNVPQYMYYTPDLNNDAHDTDLDYAGKWLTGWLTPRLPQFPPKTLVVLTFDEDDFTDNNRIFTVLLGSMIQAGSTDSQSYTHYSLLATVEENWSLGNLGKNDATATAFTF